jgi:hypothetical protein
MSAASPSRHVGVEADEPWVVSSVRPLDTRRAANAAASATPNLSITPLRDQRKTLRFGGLSQKAAEGARTLDLLHGKCAADRRNPADTKNRLFPQAFHGLVIGFEW